MTIEFNSCDVRGRKYMSATYEDKTLAMLEMDGTSIVVYGSRISQEQVDKILSKMKELQGENNGAG